MGSDRARDSFDASRKWRGLVAQQGRVTVEADWNEAAAIDDLADRLTALDIIGPLGTPDGGYAVTAGPPSTFPSPPSSSSSPPSGLETLTVGTGTLYVGGVRLELDAAVVLDSNPQPEWLDQSTDDLWVAPSPATSSPPGSGGSSPPESSNELVYLVAVEQEVSALEVPDLADVALGGPDTMQRLRILQHFVRWPTQATDCADAWTEVQSAWNTIGLDFQSSTMTLGSAARLEVSFDPEPPDAGPCEPAATGGYLGPENQLIRVQVASVDPQTGVATIVWGFDDATFLYELGSAVPGPSGGMVLTLTQPPVDSYHYPQVGQVVELLRDTAALSPTNNDQGPFDYLASASGVVTSVTSAYNPSLMNLTVADQPPGDYLSTSATPQLYLRVWQGTAEAPPGTPVELETAAATTGLQVTLTSKEGFHPGDYWSFAVRPGVPQLLYPARIAAFPQPPSGPQVWACPVAFVAWDANGAPSISPCIPPFDNLVELTGQGGGCCSIQVTPAALENSSIDDLIAPYAGAGPIRVCFAPGTYTLTEPIVLRRAFSEITLEACGPGVVLQGPPDPGPAFTLGMILIDAESVTLRGLDFELPLVTFQPVADAFAGLAATDETNTNRTLLEEFTRQIGISIAVYAVDSTALTIENCTFDFPSPGNKESLFACGVVGSGDMTGLALVDCDFEGPSPDQVSFYDLAAGLSRASSYQFTVGFAQMPTSTRITDNAVVPEAVVHDTVIEGCLFQGLTAAAIVMGNLGDIRLERDTVRDCYGGFLLISLGDPAYGLAFDVLPVGDTEIRPDLERLGMTALGDPMPLLASAMLRVLPDSPAGAAAGDSRNIATPDDATLAKLVTGMRSLFGPATKPEVTSPVSSNASDAFELNLKDSALGDIINHIGTPEDKVPTVSDTGVDITLRLEITGCQIDAVVSESYSGPALSVAEITATPGSAIIHGNRLRNRYPNGQTAFIRGLGYVAITGNVIANEINTRALKGKVEAENTRSLVLIEAESDLGTPPVAVVGNVLIDSVILPARPDGLPAWQILNTVTPWV